MRSLPRAVGVLSLLGAVLCSQAASCQDGRGSSIPKWAGRQSQWHGFRRFDFAFEQRAARIVVPDTAADGHPWVWRARFPDFHTEADRLLLKRGFHVAYLDTSGMLGSPKAMAIWDRFYKHLREQGLAARPALEGVSRGGLFVYGFADRWPQRVACIYADTPVCDFKSWPLGQGTGLGHPATWQRLLAEYDMTQQQAEAYDGNPVDRLSAIADARIPILHIVSLNDRVVPPAENTFVLLNKYRALGGKMDVMEVKEGTAKSNGHHFTHPDPQRVADFIEAASREALKASPSAGR
ncbi:MAG: alpha/beta hydrolase [Planctomycetaceae bacterium]|nr:alpha/beta hydrolase [Planctomycetaceae bacterium]